MVHLEDLVLPVGGYHYWIDDTSDELSERFQLRSMSLQEHLAVGRPLMIDEQLRDVRQQLADQTAALLRLAHMLRLQPLLDVLHQFLLHNAGRPGSNSLLADVVGLVFTDSVLEAAMGSSSSSTFSKEAYVSSMLSQPCSLTPGESGHSSQLKPTGAPKYDASSKALLFDAELLRAFAGGRAGGKVAADLQLFGGSNGYPEGKCVIVCDEGAVCLPVQLLLGCGFSDAAALEKFLTVNLKPVA